MLFCMRRQRCAFEADERELWRRDCRGRREIKLAHGIACRARNILDVSFDDQRRAGIERLRGKLDVRPPEARVAESVTKTPKRRTVEVAIGAVAHRVIVEG